MVFVQKSKFNRHLSSEHNIDNQFQLFLDTFHNGIHPTCQCSEECTEKLKWYDWKQGFLTKYVRGHNARVYTSYSNPEIAKANADKRREGYRSGKYKVWNDGLTKETNQSIADMSVRVSKTLKNKFETGERVQWNAGLTKETSQSIAKSAETFSNKMAFGELVVWNKGKTKETDENVAKYSTSLIGHNATNKLTIAKFDEHIEKLSSRFTLLSSYENYVSRIDNSLLWKCNRCDVQFSQALGKLLIAAHGCRNCKPLMSKGQIELYDFVLPICPDAISCDRVLISPRELDVFIPSKNFAIEFNGCFYHSEEYVGKTYHQDKTDACNALGVRLLHVFDDEWRDKRSIVEGMIRHRLGADIEKIDARKCTVEEISSSLAKEFFNANHIDGNVTSKKRLALLDKNNRIVACLSLREPRQKKMYPDVLEVARCCSLLGVSVRGWLGKLTKSAVKSASEYSSLLTYVDTRIGNGSAYLTAGWNELSSTSFRFWWTDGSKRFDRFKYRANKSRGMTQRQIAAEAGVKPIFGCKNLRFSIAVH